jgi:hypothetical protein
LCVGVFQVKAEDGVKRTLKGNMTEVYKETPGEAADIASMFTDGVFYGRMRFNSFLWQWDEETDGKTKDHWAVGLGGSFIYKTAYLKGFGLTAGVYTAQSPWHMDGDDYQYAKAGKDMFSRYGIATGDSYDMTVLAQAYGEYRFGKSSIRAGRQLFESLLTASNDTKMIPNAFRGVTFEGTDIPNTQIKAAWFDGQKLRDHTSFHHVLAFGDDENNPYAKWSENDDSAMHKGLTVSKLSAAGIDDRLMIFQAENKSIPNLTVMFNYTDVPDLLGSATGELNYAIQLPGGIKLTPGVRYLSQFDHGAGEIGGASIKGKVSEDDARGYSDPTSLEGNLLAARMAFSKGAASALVGYSTVSDDGDLVAPWRGFPTGGYTRAMGQYNWYANTDTWMLEAGYDFGKAGTIPGFSVKGRYAVQDYDDLKPDVPADSNILTLDFVEKIAAFQGLTLKLRSAFLSGDTDIVDMNGTVKSDPSYSEFRFEMNYLF